MRPFLKRLAKIYSIVLSPSPPHKRFDPSPNFPLPVKRLRCRLLPEIVWLGMLLLLKGLLELALLAVLVDASALLGVAECRPGAAVGVEVVRAGGLLLGLLDWVRHGPVDLVARAHGHGHRVVAVVASLGGQVLVGWLVVRVRQPLVVRLCVSVGVVHVLQVDVGAVGVPLALAVRRPVVDQRVALQAGLVPRHGQHRVLLDLLQLLLATVLLVVVVALLAVLVGLVQLAPGLAALLVFAVRLLVGTVLLGFVVVSAGKCGKADD